MTPDRVSYVTAAIAGQHSIVIVTAIGVCPVVLHVNGDTLAAGEATPVPEEEV
jgi:hypothetical protein